jgi:DNA-binding transcriptional ArsR family regulator
MTTLTAPEIFAFRSLRKTAIVYLLMLRLDRPTGANELANLLDVDLSTVRRYLDSLSAAGLIARTAYRDGYSVAAGGRQLILPGIWSNRATTAETFEASDGLLVEGERTAQNTRFEPETDQRTVENTRFELPEGERTAQNTRFEAKNTRFDESLSLKSKSLTNSIKTLDLDSTNRAKMLTAAHQLFGEPVVCQKTAPINLILGAIAECYDKREKLRKPSRVACANIKTGRVNTCYLQSPEDYLPLTFLIAAGLREPEPVFEQTAAILESEPPEPLPASASVNIPIRGRLTPESAWQQVKAALRDEMQRSPYDAYIRDTWCSNYNNGKFEISVFSEYARSWLTNRLTSTVVRILIGIINMPAEVVFVCAQTD